MPKYGWIEEADGGSALDGGGEPEDIKQVTESWKEEHPDLQVELEDNDRRVNVSNVELSDRPIYQHPSRSSTPQVPTDYAS